MPPLAGLRGGVLTPSDLVVLSGTDDVGRSFTLKNGELLLLPLLTCSLSSTDWILVVLLASLRACISAKRLLPPLLLLLNTLLPEEEDLVSGRGLEEDLLMLSLLGGGGETFLSWTERMLEVRLLVLEGVEGVAVEVEEEEEVGGGVNLGCAAPPTGGGGGGGGALPVVAGCVALPMGPFLERGSGGGGAPVDDLPFSLGIGGGADGGGGEEEEVRL